MAENKPRLSVNHCIVCDDVRREVTHKLILIGVYTGQIQVQEFPVGLNLACWLDVTAAGTGKIPIKFRFLRQPDGQEFPLAEGDVEIVNEQDFTNFTVSPAMARLEEPGTLQLQMQQYDEDWETVRDITVTQVSQTQTAPTG